MRSSKSVTLLDSRLYAWLAEPDPRRFERAFAEYFAVAFPAVQRHLGRLSRWDAAELEELAQDALLRFFDRVGTRRREASETVRDTLPTVRPLNLGTFHERQVLSWTQDTESFRQSAMSFRLAESAAPEADFKEPIRRLADRVGPLQGRGSHLLQAVEKDLRWEIASATFREPSDADAGAAGSEDALVSALRFADSVTSAVEFHAAVVQAAEQRVPGITRFVAGIACVVRLLPHLRIPTNGYLFDMALTIYLDECKKRGRKKRGGSGFLSPELRGDVHPLDRLGPDYDDPLNHDEGDSTPDAMHPVSVGAHGAYEPSVDPTLSLENLDFFEKFYAYLRLPLDTATADYETAKEHGTGKTQLKKLESVSNKFARTIAVLALMGEGHTQEQVAAQLQLSRNQVKYIIEVVQEAYQRFARVDTTGAAHGTSAGVEPHG